MIDKNKQYRTRDGREVRIYATDGNDDEAIHGAVKDRDGWKSFNWYRDGIYARSDRNGPHDLIEVRPRHKQTVWLNAYNNGIVAEACSSKERADLAAGCNRLACIKVELDFEEGQGL